jgi:hypothetical protein
MGFDRSNLSIDSANNICYLENNWKLYIQNKAEAISKGERSMAKLIVNEVVAD